MRVALFFIALCFLLLKGNAPVVAGVRSIGNRYSNTQRAVRSIHLQERYHAHAVITTVDPDHELDYLISDVSEDDESNDFPPAKDRLPARSHLPYTHPHYPVVARDCNKCFKAPPFFFRPMSDRYIFLRVLRI